MRSRLERGKRLKSLNLACRRVEIEATRLGRPRTLSVLRVAREAGVSPALIHNHYPEIAARIRRFRGIPAVSRPESELLRLKSQNAELRRQLGEARKDQASLASQLAAIKLSSMARVAAARPR